MDTDQRNRIIEEGKKLIDIYGFRKFTMDELAQNLRISKRTIYQYFENKDKLISSIIDSFIENDREELIKIVNQKEDYVEKLRAVFFLYNIRTLRKKHLNELRKFFPEEWKKFKTFSESRKMFVKKIYNEGVEKGIFTAKIPRIPNLPATIEENQTVDLLIFILTSITDQAFETELTEYDFDINTMLMYSFELISKAFLNPEKQSDSTIR